MTGVIPFGRESWVAVNLYSMRTDGRQTLTLDGEPSPNYSPARTVAYLDQYECGPHELGIGGTFLPHQDERARASGPRFGAARSIDREGSRPLAQSRARAGA